MLMELLEIVLAIVSLIIVLVLVFGYILSRSVIHLDRQPVPKNPADYGMTYQRVDLTAEDGLAKEMVVVHKGPASAFFLIENLEVILRNLIIFSLFNEFF